MARMSNDGNILRPYRDNGGVQSDPDNGATVSRIRSPDHPCPPEPNNVQCGARPMNSPTSNRPAASPFIRPDGLMMEDVLSKLDAAELTLVRRRDLKSAIRSLCRLIGRSPAEIPANINWVHIQLRRIHPAQADMSAKSLKNIRSSALKALELCGASRARSDWLQAPSEEWAELLALAPSQTDKWKLTQFAQYCSALNVPPQNTSGEHLRSFLKALQDETFIDKPEVKVSAITSAWNRLSRDIQGWPNITLAYPRRKEAWTFPLTTFPESFQEDVAGWIQRLTSPDPLIGDGPAKPLRPATIKHWKFQIQQMASAIVRSGTPIGKIDSLAFIVDTENLKNGLRYMMSRFGNAPTEAIHAHAIKMKAIARHHVKVGDDQLNELSGLCRRLQRGGPGLRAKNQARLEKLDDDSNLALLLNLPRFLVQLAAKSGLTSHRQALAIQAALCIEILLHAPMRMGNLSRISLDRHIRRAKVKGKDALLLSIPGEEVKNGRALFFELTGDALQIFDLYMQTYRPVLLRAASEYVFPAQDGGPKRVHTLSTLISSTIREHTGLTVHAHLFRSIAGKIHCMINPGDFLTLGHAIGDSLQTAMKSYAQFEQKNAVRHYQASVTAARDLLSSRGRLHG